MSLISLFSSFGYSDPTPATDSGEGVVYVIDGVGGVGYFPRNLEDAFRDCGIPYQVRQHYWSHGYGRWYQDLTDGENIGVYAEALADAVVGYQTRNPGQPVFVVARSGGTAVALEAMTHLEPDAVEKLVLLNSGLSPEYDMRPSLPAVRTEVVSFWSPRDSFVLGLGTRTFGTLDGVRTRAAGRVGFTVPEVLSHSDQRQYEKLRQVEWQPEMRQVGHGGNHLGSAATDFLKAYVAPLIDTGDDSG